MRSTLLGAYELFIKSTHYMNTKTYIAGTTALALMLITGAGTVSAYRGDYTQTGPSFSDERHEAMETAFEEVDYDAWKELMDNRGRVTDVITEDNFAQFAEAHTLADDGDFEGAKEIREELGLGNHGERMGAGHRGGRGQGFDMERSECFRD